MAEVNAQRWRAQDARRGDGLSIGEHLDGSKENILRLLQGASHSRSEVEVGSEQADQKQTEHQKTVKPETINADEENSKEFRLNEEEQETGMKKDGKAGQIPVPGLGPDPVPRVNALWKDAHEHEAARNSHHNRTTQTIKLPPPPGAPPVAQRSP